MKGYLESRRIKVAEHKIAASLEHVAPESHKNRRHNVVNKTKPIPYEAHYFGHKIRLDQNEELAMFGVTHIIAVDGYSRMIVGDVTVPIKNNLFIFSDVYRKAVQDHGLWH